jgi:predicted lysophospholipase L1 biosynthesis ABC-type transport system permease subunit
MVVNRAFVNLYWPDGSAIGRRIRIFSQGPWYRVVGVVGSVRAEALQQAPEPLVYAPVVAPLEDARWRLSDVAFVVRTSTEPGAVAAAVRSALRSLDEGLPIFRMRPLTEVTEAASARTWFVLMLLAAAAAIALVLGAIGVYGVLSYVVSLRTREIGVRLALGAPPPDVRWMVWSQGVTIASIGVAIGVVLALAAGRVLATLLFEVSPTDPAALASASAALFSVGVIASWWPARRAARLDPAVALREE